MNRVLQKLLKWMFRKHIIGHKHIPEDLLVKSKICHLNKHQQKEFYVEYEELIRRNVFWRLKKKTGQGSEWHISLNPDNLEEIKNDIGEQDEDSGWEIL